MLIENPFLPSLLAARAPARGLREVGQDEGAATSRRYIVTKIALRSRFHCVHLPVHSDTQRKPQEVECW